MSRYLNPEFDGLLDAYFRTVPIPDRVEALGQIIHHIADRVSQVGIFYNPNPAAASEPRREPEQGMPDLVHHLELPRVGRAQLRPNS